MTAPPSSFPVLGNTCRGPSAPWQQWSVSGQQLLSADGCLTAGSWPVADKTALFTAPCGSVRAEQQAFNFTSGDNISIVVAAAPTFCVNLQGYGTSPGTIVWLYTCSPSDCKENCAWAASGGAITNPGSGLCLDDGHGPVAPHVCDDGSPSADLPFCNGTAPIDERVLDLWGRLNDTQRIQLFSIPIQPNPYDPVLNLPSVYWDITCIAGLSPGRFNPQPNVTVFPSTLGQAATFDVDLVARIGAATALEGRIVNQVNYRLTGGTTWQGVLCDGGPLANTAHDPRWGRISETYGEDYWLTAAMGIAATRALQQRTAPTPASGGLDFLLTSQVTRHFMGTHGASDLPHDAEEWIAPLWLEEHQMRVYEAFQRPDQGDAEGIMCAISAIATAAGDVPPPRNNLSSGVRPYVPNCVSDYLLTTKLRQQWGSGCFVQSDCCDSIDAIVAHDWVATLPEAVAGAVNAGLSASYGNPGGITAALQAALASGAISAATFAARIQRTLLTLFRVGLFDTASAANPYRGPWDEAQLDGPEHRALAREAAARAAVLLENGHTGGADQDAPLPLPALTAASRVAVIGPFADCTSRDGGYGGHDADGPPLVCSYGHSYSGYMSAVSSYLSAAQAEAAGAGGAQVRYAQGSGVVAPAAGGLADAAAAAAWGDVVLLALGTGSQLEVEGRDRTTLRLPDAQLALAAAVAAALPPAATLVVVLVSAGPVDFDLPRADAVLFHAYAGEETGAGLWDVLLGRVAPSARLPLTAYADAYLGIVAPLANFNMVTLGVGGRTYRWLNDSAAVAAHGAAANVTSFIRHRFGYGLSYCRFTYSGLAAAANANGSVTVTVDVAATWLSPAARAAGVAACREATQVHVTLPPQADGTPVPVYSLAAFASTLLPVPPAAPVPLRFLVPADALLTTRADGSRALAGGAYTFAVSGHLPDDDAGTARGSNVLATVVRL